MTQEELQTRRKKEAAEYLKSLMAEGEYEALRGVYAAMQALMPESEET